ncbi:APC family permease [Lipingzhangella sp. LS1_29]|uniref:APC family permease n=1 Tax=Lipingzhangella rawalii TaxID=2055835 RepID=A0ABU2H6X9_9ACTN|nr:APC family permease [Lipingzhangella rawalii]MDS1271063.1 APC family permease [Lipingzhangella rawalii]
MAAPTGAQPIDRKIGLLGGMVLMTGTVVGISVFVLPGELIGAAGPSIALALALTVVPMVFSILALLQLGGAMPVAGGQYVYPSRLVKPLWGYISLFMIIGAIWSTLLFTAVGFAEFMRFFVDLPAPALAFGVLLGFLILNLLGVRLVTGVQIAMVCGIFLGSLAFIIPGSGQIDVGNYSPFLPEGLGPMLLAMISLYIPFQGYSMIVELGEELKNPVRNIPRVLALGMTVSVLLSVGLVGVFVGLDSWTNLAAYGGGGIAQAAGEAMPTAIGGAVAAAAILGALTTVNALVISYSRTLMRAGRDDVISSSIARIHPVSQVPHRAVIVLVVPPMVGALFTPDVVLLTTFLGMIILYGNIMTAFGLWNLPKRYPEHYRTSIYRLPMPLLRITAIVSATIAALLWLVVLAGAPGVFAAVCAVLVAGAIGYVLRRRAMLGRGIDLDERLRHLHSYETHDPSAGSAAEALNRAAAASRS